MRKSQLKGDRPVSSSQINETSYIDVFMYRIMIVSIHIYKVYVYINIHVWMFPIGTICSTNFHHMSRFENGDA